MGFEPTTACLGSRNSTTELHPRKSVRFRAYFRLPPKACQRGGLAWSKTGTKIRVLLEGYRLCDRAEDKSPHTVDIVTCSVSGLEWFLRGEGLSTDIAEIDPNEIRTFILQFQQRRRYRDHRFARPQETGLSLHTINTYLRSIRAFWSWMVSEDILPDIPFSRVKVPKTPTKVVATFSESQIQALLRVIDTSTPYRTLRNVQSPPCRGPCRTLKRSGRARSRGSQARRIAIRHRKR